MGFLIDLLTEMAVHGDFDKKPPASAQATEDDIYYAYRLLLGREPDAQGWNELRRIIADRTMAPDELARGFLDSPEFAQTNGSQQPRDGFVEVALDGFVLFVRADDRDIGGNIRATRTYEPHVTHAMKELLRPGDVFVDIGANIGFFTNLAARLVGSDGFVLAVEPMDKNVQLILRSLERNGFAHVRVLACAASDREGRVAMRTDPGTSNGQAVATGMAGQRTLYAQTLRLDDVSRDLTRIDLVKLDIEGFELLAWRGFRDGLARHRPRVLTEFHPYCMRQFVGIEPEEYLVELFAYAGAVDVVPTEGPRVRCAAPDDVMREWHTVNERANAAGKYHLDLLVHPRS
jgi:FkbM family methyltransferase